MKNRKYSTRISKNKISKEYRAWKGMKARCYAKCNNSMGYYQKHNITVCDRWLNSFDNFMDDMGYCPSDKHSLDRINNSKGYSPDNCRWALHAEQVKNRTNFNLYFTYKGETKILKDWAKQFGIKYTTLYMRIKKAGKSFEEAIKF